MIFVGGQLAIDNIRVPIGLIMNIVIELIIGFINLVLFVRRESLMIINRFFNLLSLVMNIFV